MWYVISLYLISKYDIETKYPKIKKYLKYYTKSSEFFLILELILGLLILISIILLNFYLFYMTV